MTDRRLVAAVLVAVFALSTVGGYGTYALLDDSENVTVDVSASGFTETPPGNSPQLQEQGVDATPTPNVTETPTPAATATPTPTPTATATPTPTPTATPTPTPTPTSTSTPTPDSTESSENS